MTVKIQKPTLGRVVHFQHAKHGFTCVAFVNKVYDDGVVNLWAIEQGVLEDEGMVPHDADGSPGTWRYPPRCDDFIEVER